MFRRHSEEMIAPALDRLKAGDPSVVGEIYQLIDHLHPDIRRQVFIAIQSRLVATSDQALCARLRDQGVKDLADDFPRLAIAIRQYSRRQWTSSAKEVRRQKPYDIHAASLRGRHLRNVILSLPMTSLCGAKLRVVLGRITALYNCWMTSRRAKRKNATHGKAAGPRRKKQTIVRPGARK